MRREKDVRIRVIGAERATASAAADRALPARSAEWRTEESLVRESRGSARRVRARAWERGGLRDQRTASRGRTQHFDSSFAHLGCCVARCGCRPSRWQVSWLASRQRTPYRQVASKHDGIRLGRRARFLYSSRLSASVPRENENCSPDCCCSAVVASRGQGPDIRGRRPAVAARPIRLTHKQKKKAQQPAQSNASGESGIGWGSSIEVGRLASAAEDALRRGNPSAAADYAQRAVKAAPQDNKLWFLLGYTSRLAGRYQTSVEAYQHGLQDSRRKRRRHERPGADLRAHGAHR